MKNLITTIFVLVLYAGIFSQPMNGAYTVGGTTPDFGSPQDAVNALKVNGVSGPVFFNIRPGIYMKNGGNNTVLILDSIITGLSESNRITFQPDANEGGNVGNTILQMNITDPPTSDIKLVFVSQSFITFKNITFQESDASINTGTCNLVQLERNFLLGSPPVSGVVFEGCRFIGTDPSAGTENGIEFGTGIRDITIRGNVFLRLLRGISGITSTAISDGTIIVEDNQFLAGWRTFSGSGNPLGSAMEIFSQNLFIRKNVIDFNESFNGGYRGISVNVPNGTQSVIVEKNTVVGSVSSAITLNNFIGGQSDSLVVVNNMINANVYAVWANESAYGINVSGLNNAKIFFNTVVLKGSSIYGLSITGADCVALNNIIIIKPSGGFSTCYNQGNQQSTNLISDYNVIFMQPTSVLVIRDGAQYATLGQYQAATALDTNSISKDIDFIDSADVHISDCQAQDPDLLGIPAGGIIEDIDEETRNDVAPMIGADENGFRSFNMFADPFRASLTGTGFDIAAGNFDNLIYDGIAVPDYDNRQVLLYHNLPPRSFILSTSLPTSFKPVAVKFYDLDEDNNLDLIVGGDTSAVSVFWGDGAGGFSSPITIQTFGRVRSLMPGPTLTGNIKRTIVITQDNGFVSSESTVGYLMHLGNRNLCHDVQWFQTNINPPIFSFPDTVDAVMTNLVYGEFSGDGNFPEIAAVTSSPLPHPMIIVSDIDFPGFPGNCTSNIAIGTINEYLFGSGVGSSAGQSNIIMGDFDGDTDLDLITLETFSSVLFIKNQGGLNFTSESISASGAMGLASLDYENDGDLDFLTVNDRLEENGITVFLNDGFGNFTTRENCFFPFATGLPRSVVASDFDKDGKTDVAIVSSFASGIDSLFVLYNLGGGTVGIQEQESVEIPNSYSLTQNFPNPFNPSTTIQFSIPVSGLVKLSIYNILGEEVKTLLNEEKSAGNHSVQFNANNLASGIYLYRIQAGSLVETKKMILLK